jgi:hypothetical protein
MYNPVQEKIKNRLPIMKFRLNLEDELDFILFSSFSIFTLFSLFSSI